MRRTMAEIFLIKLETISEKTVVAASLGLSIAPKIYLLYIIHHCVYELHPFEESHDVACH